jgi:hypothetical protein
MTGLIDTNHRSTGGSEACGTTESSTSPISFLELMDNYGPYGGGEPQEDSVVFDRLQGFGQAVWRLENYVQREHASQVWIDWLKKNWAVSVPWRLVETAVKEGKRFVSVPSDWGVRKEFKPQPLADWAAEDGGAATSWVVDGYALRGGLTAIAGPPKAGKTTFCADLATRVASGFGFLERRCDQAVVLWLDYEQHAQRTVQMFSELDALDLPIHLESSPIANCSIDELRAYVVANDVGLVVLDSLSRYWGATVQDENDAAQVQAAVGPLLQLARTANCAILTIHHTRKSGGEHGMDFRGSGALTGIVDIAVSFQRPTFRDETGSQRILESISRYSETPRKLVVALEDGLYTAKGDPSDIKRENRREKILAALSADEAMTPDEVADATELKSGTVRPLLSELFQNEQVEREGSGVKNDPWRYKKKLSVPENTRYGNEYGNRRRPTPLPARGMEEH